MRILWGSPLPPTRSGVSDYAVELLPELGRIAEVRLLTPPGWTRPEDWPLDALEMVAADLEPAADEVCLVHLGNNPYHEWLLPRLVGPRVVAVVHDLVLHHLLVEATVANGRYCDFQERLTSAHGEAAGALARARRVGISGRRDPFLFPATAAFLDRAAAVVVHSQWAQRQIALQLPRLPLARVGLPATDPAPVDNDAIRRGLGLDGDEVVLMHVGFLTPEKGLEEVLGGVAAAARSGVPVRLVLVGEGRLLSEIGAVVEALGLAGRVTATGWVSAGRLRELPAAADLGVVLRTPSAGETSAAAVRFLACGTPVAVGGTRQFLEWPESAAPRLTPGPAAPAELARLLGGVAAERRSGAWSTRRAAARQAYEQGHRPAMVAQQLVDFLERVFG